jgi:hypothetical protein
MAFQPHAGVHTSYFLGVQRCPQCMEEVFAAEGATLVPEGVRFEWCCDLCGHRFETAEAADATAGD